MYKQEAMFNVESIPSMLHRNDVKHNVNSGHISSTKKQAEANVFNVSTDSATSASLNTLHKKRTRTKLKVFPVP